MKPLRILLADDHPLVRAGVRKILESQPGLMLVEEVADGNAALRVLREQPVEVLVLDLTMPGLDGFEVLRQAKALVPGLKVLVLTMHSDPEYVERAVHGGADGYLLKDSAVNDLVAGIEAVAGGRAYYSPAVQRSLSEMVRATVKPPGALETLTDREREVLKLIANGKRNREIATELFISEKTVKNHVSNILWKLQVNDRTEAALFAARQGLV
jgi:DNA-binding NarL/FixJ family response regulator